MTKVIPKCPLCSYRRVVYRALMITTILHLIRVTDNNGQDIPGQFSIAPKKHIGRDEELPIGWEKALSSLLRRIIIDANAPLNSLSVTLVTDDPTDHVHWQVKLTTV